MDKPIEALFVELIKVPSCHNNPQNPFCIDLTLMNSPLRVVY